MKAFDMLARAVKSRHIPQFQEGMVRDGKVFTFDIDSLFPDIGTMDPETRQAIRDRLNLSTATAILRLGLPFPKTTLVTSSAVVTYYQEPGSNTVNWVLYCATKKYTNLMCYGTLTANYTGDELKLKVTMGDIIYDQNGVVHTSDIVTPDTLSLGKSLEEMLCCNYHLILGLNTIDRFVLEVTPRKVKLKNRPNYIPLQHERPEYIILRPLEIRKLLGLANVDTGRVQGSHERRGHIRTYPDDKERYPNAHGRSIWIEAIWIGESEAIIGNRKYKVMLDNPNQNKGA